MSKTEFAWIAGVAKPSISVACRKAFPAALVGLRVDIDHPDAQRYLANKDGAATRLASFCANGGSRSSTPQQPSTPSELAARVPQRSGARHRVTAMHARSEPHAINVEACLEMTLREVCELHGSLPAFIDVLEAVRRLKEIRERDLRFGERSGQLISRDLVRIHVFAHLDALARRLLTDMPATLVRKARANLPLEEAEVMARELISSQLQKAKGEITRALAHREQGEADVA